MCVNSCNVVWVFSMIDHLIKNDRPSVGRTLIQSFFKCVCARACAPVCVCAGVLPSAKVSYV